MSIRIARATSEHDRRAAFQVRHQVFVDELGYQIPGATAEVGLSSEADAEAALFVAWNGDTPVGTVAIDRCDSAAGPTDEYRRALQLDHFGERFAPESMIVARKALLLPGYRGTGLFGQLLGVAYAHVHHRGLEFVFADCSPYLVRYYETFGFRRYAPHFSYDASGIIAVPVCLLVRDHVYLERIGSPVLPMLSSLGTTDSAAGRDYFQRYWRPPSGPARTPAEALKTATAMSMPVRRYELRQSALFTGLSTEAVRALLDGCETVAFEAGERLTIEGELDRTVYLLASGYTEVVKARATGEGGEGALAVATMGPGALFGEVPLLLGGRRSATVRALTTGVAYVLSPDAFSGAPPAVSARLFRNLAAMLAERLRAASLWITETPPL